jgi:hypothetical protein
MTSVLHGNARNCCFKACRPRTAWWFAAFVYERNHVYDLGVRCTLTLGSRVMAKAVGKKSSKRYASISRTTWPYKSVKRKSRPA